MNDTDDTQPSLTQDKDGVISIKPGGKERALKDQEADMKKKEAEINEVTEDPNAREPGAPA